MSKHTETIRLRELDGTYEIVMEEVKRRKLTTKDELIPIIASLASQAQHAVDNTNHLLTGEKDPYLAFARRFINYLQDTEDDLFIDFLKEKDKL